MKKENLLSTPVCANAPSCKKLCLPEYPGVRNILEEFCEDSHRYIYMFVLIDTSPSVAHKMDDIYQSNVELLKELAERDRYAEDFKLLIQVATFNDTVNYVTNGYQTPEDALKLFDREQFRCKGTTNFGAIYEALDHEASHTGLFQSGGHTNDPMPFVIIETDAMANDNIRSRQDQENILNTNAFYKDSVVKLCVFFGEDKFKGEAVKLAGGNANNVIALEENLAGLLTPVLLKSTIINQNTHLTGASDTRSIAEETRRSEEEGASSARQLTSEKERMIQEFDDLMNGVG